MAQSQAKAAAYESNPRHRRRVAVGYAAPDRHDRTLRLVSARQLEGSPTEVGHELQMVLRGFCQGAALIAVLILWLVSLHVG